MAGPKSSERQDAADRRLTVRQAPVPENSDAVTSAQDVAKVTTSKRIAEAVASAKRMQHV